MLSPRDRSLLLDALRPPPGYKFDRAIATTYTLDLLALLTAPLAFTFFDCEDEEGRPSADPLALLEAVRRHARRLHVFCQGGAIHAPKGGQVLLAHLEPCVVEVAAPRGGVFHPKLWVLRYEPDDVSAGEPVQYRLLVGTRNLTFDRSWDTLLRLDGVEANRRTAIARNRPLSRFVASLPSLAVHGASADAEEVAARFADELLHVRWELPDKVSELEFLPLGLDQPSWPFDRGRRRLVVAPFVDAWFLERMGGDRGDGIVISRPDSLQEAAAGLGAIAERFVLTSEVEAEEGLDEPEIASDGEDVRLSGLHAKLFVLDDGHATHVFTGSANATRAALERNVEFMVRLTGTKLSLGIEALLAREERGGLFDLLEPWEPADVVIDEERALRDELEGVAEAARRELARADLRLELVRQEETAGKGDNDGHALVLELHGALPDMDPRVRLTCWPAVLSHRVAVTPAASTPIARFRVSLGAATAFFGFELVARGSGLEHRLRFVRRLPLGGLPADRDEQLLRILLKDRDTVLRLLSLLLSAEEISAGQLARFVTGEGRGQWDGSRFGLPVFEPLVRALARGPDALAPVVRLVNDLDRTQEGRALLPEGFEGLWAAVTAAREVLHR